MLANNDFHELGPASAEFMRAAAQLIPMLLRGLPPGRADSVFRMLDGGYVVGAEALCDRQGNTSVNVTVVSSQGVRTVIAAVAMPLIVPTPIQ